MTWVAAVDVAVDGLTTAERGIASFATLLALAAVLHVAYHGSARRDSRVSSVVAGAAAIVSIVAACAALVVAWDAEVTAWEGVAGLQLQAELLVRAFVSVAFLAAVYVGTGVLHGMVDRFMTRREGVTDHQAEVTYRIIQISVYVFAFLAVLGFWDVNLSGLLVGAGFAGIVLGMAARQTLGSLIAGLVLLFSRPFEIGDWVQVGDKDGIVTDITIVNTRLQTFDGEYVMLPNDQVGSNEIVNRSRKGRLRIHVSVGVDYGTDVERAMKTAEGAMGDVDAVMTVPRPKAVLEEFGDSAVVLDLRFWIDKPSARRKWRAQTAVIAEVKSAFDDAGVGIPFPQRSLSARDADGGFRVRETPADASVGDGDAVRGGDAGRRTSGRSAGDGRGDAGDGRASGGSGIESAVERVVGRGSRNVERGDREDD